MARRAGCGAPRWRRSPDLVEFIQEEGKVYEGEITLGFSTTTEDAGGDILERTPVTELCNNSVSHIVDGCRYLLDGTTGSAEDVRAAIIGSLLVLAVMAPLTILRYQRRNA